METRKLFDGAFECQLPKDIVDASNLRQIPDNQEVFVHPLTDQSVTIDILEAVSSPNPESAARTHFQEIASSNEASESIIDSVDVLPPPYPDENASAVVRLTGKQKVAKFNQTREDMIFIHLALYRYESDKADVLVVINDPLKQTVNNSRNAESTSWGTSTINSVLFSLRLKNRGIFGSN
ncbi:unnamed protein product [Calicophoron daubneyi]|uniref:Ran guanine nucleotide release factor n=1 Tax=Calicophoron daubneyi TaxID=300641 RepID=A0AAV2U2A1_CALDB